MKIVQNILNSRSDDDGNFFLMLRKMLGFSPKHLGFYRKAFTHRSANRKDRDGNPMNYERLEFLGDTMLSTIISYYLFKMVPAGDEGYLTKMRSKVVSREHLNELGKELGLVRHIDSRISRESFGENIHGNLFEALLGAIYLDRGYKYCEKFVYRRVIEPYVDIERLEGKIISYKSFVIEWCQKEKKSFSFEVYEDSGNESVRHFSVRLFIEGKVISKGRATSKKKAEEQASKRAYYALQDKMQ
ncbi:ribonuclease III [Sinomicrobium soli]|uniref:ribonuclease III n=1 Tax=Sinomicrobium sp. N-1-3-6 TaxID=2219864 RepID=UPI000DCB7043|nr:ribonuclease III [Sinomicrobium sp. N-1-3-6]RAV28263.1 ribonuclease III [Sinomicrobium sp. N-1-3-6]